MYQQFAANEIHVVLPVEPIFHLGPLPITNSMLLGAVGVIAMLAVLGYAAWKLKNNK